MNIEKFILIKKRRIESLIAEMEASFTSHNERLNSLQDSIDLEVKRAKEKRESLSFFNTLLREDYDNLLRYAYNLGSLQFHLYYGADYIASVKKEIEDACMADPLQGTTDPTFMINRYYIKTSVKDKIRKKIVELKEMEDQVKFRESFSDQIMQIRKVLKVDGIIDWEFEYI